MRHFKPTNPKDRSATNKLDLSLFPTTALCYGALGMTEGDCKYGSYNYRNHGVLASVYIAACYRHLGKWFNGEEADPKTRVHHLGSAIACIAVLIDARECGILKDNRPPHVSLSRLLTQAQAIVTHLHKKFPRGRNAEKTKRTTVPKVSKTRTTPKKRK